MHEFLPTANKSAKIILLDFLFHYSMTFDNDFSQKKKKVKNKGKESWLIIISNCFNFS